MHIPDIFFRFLKNIDNAYENIKVSARGKFQKRFLTTCKKLPQRFTELFIRGSNCQKVSDEIQNMIIEVPYRR